MSASGQRALKDVAEERLRQVRGEGFSPTRDDLFTNGELARAAACYAWAMFDRVNDVPIGWPWASLWWKPKTRRRDLVRAAALIVAEIERLDRVRPMRKAP